MAVFVKEEAVPGAAPGTPDAAEGPLLARWSASGEPTLLQRVAEATDVYVKGVALGPSGGTRLAVRSRAS